MIAVFIYKVIADVFILINLLYLLSTIYGIEYIWMTHSLEWFTCEKKINVVVF